MDLLALAQGLAAREAKRPSEAFHRLVAAVDGDEAMPLSDRDLIAATQHAIHAGEKLYALAALDELALRVAAQEPVESILRASA